MKKNELNGYSVELGSNQALNLDCGVELNHFIMAFQTYGRLNKNKTNAILVCHALTGDQHAANTHPLTGKPGWWENMIGSGKPLDTDRFLVICINVLGGCMGSTGPGEINPQNGEPWGLSFPVVTIADMVRAQARVIEYLGIKKLFSVIGGSMGGMQTLQWASLYPDKICTAIPIASAARHSAQNIAFHEVGRQAIIADPKWENGNYSYKSSTPKSGLAVARMAAHVTYLSQAALRRKFGRRLQNRQEKIHKNN